jgi:hypothetical protein
MDNWIQPRGCGATLAVDLEAGRKKGWKLVLGGDTPFTARLADDLRRLGCEVCVAADATGVRRLALRKGPQAVLLPDAAMDESGYLICAKLRAANPRLRVVLLGARRTPKAERFARFVGAAFVAEIDGTESLLKAITGES